MDCSNLNAVILDDTPQISAKQAEDKRRLEAKRLAQLRRKISAISQNSLKSPNAKLSVYNDRHVSKSKSMDEYGVEKLNDPLREKSINSVMTASTLCDKSTSSNSEIAYRGSLPRVTVVSVDSENSSTSTTSDGTPNRKIWVTNSSKQTAVCPNADSPAAQVSYNAEGEILQSNNGVIVSVNNMKIGRKDYGNHETPLENCTD